MLLLAVSLFFTHPAPLDMPCAEAYFVKGADGSLRLEDRYDVNDLWTSRAVLGRWEDDDGRVLTISRLDTVPPLATETTLTRKAYTADEIVLDPKKDTDLRDQAVSRLSPVETVAEPVSPHQKVRGFKEILYYEGTNASAVVCAFLREGARTWYLASWELAEGDEYAWARELFEEEILEKWEDIVQEHLRSETAFERLAADLPERALLRADARHSVTNYTAWHVTEAEEFSVLDNLPDAMRFVATLTNDLSVMRRRYAETMPSPVNGSNVLAVARIYANREDYLAAAGEEMAWSAAYWSPQRRELVAYLPEGGAEDLLRTIRHEAFHQYFSYAASMISPSPWINEGYAQFFEDGGEGAGDLGLDADLDDLARLLTHIMMMDYEAFYDGDSVTRRAKYRLAWSIAVFLEKGAPDVRFEPFKNLKRDYVAALLKTKDMRLATIEAFGEKETLELFVREWKKFWASRL